MKNAWALENASLKYWKNNVEQNDVYRFCLFKSYSCWELLLFYYSYREVVSLLETIKDQTVYTIVWSQKHIGAWETSSSYAQGGGTS